MSCWIILSDPLNFGRAYGLHPAKLWESLRAAPRQTLGTPSPNFSENPRDFSDDLPLAPP